MDAVHRKLQEVCRVIKVDNIDIGDITPVGNGRLYRASVRNDVARRDLLAAASKLRFLEEYRQVLIQKDLTSHQRQLLAEKRGNRTEMNSSSGNKFKRCMDWSTQRFSWSSWGC